MSEMSCFIYNTTRTRIDKSYFRHLALHSLKAAGSVGKYNIILVFVGAKKILRLNREYRHYNSVTDVLSFLYSNIPLEGEIYICVPQARKQALRYGHSLKIELSQLVIHGVLHLLGYDHQTKRIAAKMMRMEKKIWQSFQKKHS